MGSADLIQEGDSAYASGQLEGAFDAWERAHESYLREGDPVGAAGAATRIAMHLMIDTGLLAPVRTWIRRAEQLLDAAGSPVPAALGLARAYERLFSGDFPEARRWTQAAIEAGVAADDHSATAMARVAQARCHIFEGDVDAGSRMLEEASIAAASGGVDDLTMGMTYCEIVCAWQSLAMYDLAERWTDAMERFSHRHAIGSVGGRCAIHRAQILRLRGECRAAEAEALRACDTLRPYMRREFGWPLTELGVIRLQLGDLQGAEDAFLLAHEKGWEPQPGLALLRLAQGDVAAASSLIGDALERPLDLLSKELPPNNDLRRAPLLAAQVEIALAARDIRTARAASEELTGIARNFRSPALEATASLAAGRIRLAEGAAADAAMEFRSAVHVWSEVSAPFELGLARLGLGRAHRAQGFDEGARLEFTAARTAFEQVGAKEHAAVAAAELEGDDRRRTSAAGDRFERNGDYWTVAFDGSAVLLRDMKGLRYLARLLAQPGREYHALDLVAMERGTELQARSRRADGLSRSMGGDAGELLDDQAKAVYRRRLAEIEEDIEEARAFGDDERATRAERERASVVGELARAVGMGGRDRRAGAVSERARAAVTRAIRNAMRKVGEEHAALGEHLDHSIRTGTYCAYAPDPRSAAEWAVRGV